MKAQCLKITEQCVYSQTRGKTKKWTEAKANKLPFKLACLIVPPSYSIKVEFLESCVYKANLLPSPLVLFNSTGSLLLVHQNEYSVKNNHG